VHHGVIGVAPKEFGSPFSGAVIDVFTPVMMKADGAVIGGGSPLADARGFGQWEAARLLVERGARTTLTDAATLGIIDRVEARFRDGDMPMRDAITRAFWGACHGGQRVVAEYLLARGADVNWIGHGGMTPLDAPILLAVVSG
jgi:uncharacterized protein